MKLLFYYISFFFLQCGVIFAATLNVTPDLLNTGVSNITTAFIISTPNSENVPWETQTDFGSNPAWFILSAETGTVNSTTDNSVPVTIRRDRLPVTGIYSAAVIVLGGDNAHTVTVVTALTKTDGGIFPKINGDFKAFAGIPYQLDARSSIGWISEFYWLTNYSGGDPLGNQILSTNVSDETIFDIPDEFTLSLYAKDAHGNGQIDSIPFRVWNSPPTVNAGGPYFANVGDTVTVVAVGTDPNPNEELLYSWQFNPPDGQFTPLSHSPTATYHFTESYNSYFVCVVSDTWTGAVGTYNAPLGGQGIARILVTNQPPTVDVAFLSNAVWTSWSNNYEIIATSLPATNITLRANPADPDSLPGLLSVEWREDPENPVHDIIGKTDRTNQVVVLKPLSKPGVYRFEVVAYDGEDVSKTAEILVSTPGVVCNVVADNFQTMIPIWGAYSSATNLGNTNAFGVHDETEATRSDFDGWLYLDRPADAQCFVELERGANGDNALTGIYFSTTSENIGIRKQLFKFPTKKFPYAGKLIDGANAVATLIVHPGIQVPTRCTEEGIYSFGDLSKSLPVDNPTSHFYIVFIKEGRKSLCVEKPLNSITGSLKPDVYDLPTSTNSVILNGKVISSISGLAVPGARIRFGNYEAISSTSKNSLGLFKFDSLPEPYSPNSSFPTHVLTCHADGYQPTRSIFYNSSTGGFVTIILEENVRYIHGTVYDPELTNRLSEGTIETHAGDGFSPVSVSISKSGYFSIPAPQQCDYITIFANGLSQDILLNKTGGQPLQKDIIFTGVPEPTFFILYFLPFILSLGQVKSEK